MEENSISKGGLKLGIAGAKKKRTKDVTRPSSAKAKKTKMETSLDVICSSL